MADDLTIRISADATQALNSFEQVEREITSLEEPVDISFNVDTNLGNIDGLQSELDRLRDTTDLEIDIDIDTDGVASDLDSLITQSERLSAEFQDIDDDIFRDLERATSAFNDDLQDLTGEVRDFARSLDGLDANGIANTAPEFNRLQESIRRVTQESLRLEQQVEEVTRALRDDATAEEITDLRRLEQQYEETAREARQLETELNSLNQTARNTNLNENTSGASDFNTAIGRLGKAFVGLIAAYGALEVAQKALEFERLAEEALQTEETFTLAVERMGKNSIETFNEIKEASRGLISDASIQQMTVAANALGIPLDQMATLMEIAATKARVMGISTEEAFGKLTEGLSKMEPELLDSLGLTMKLSTVYEKYAKEIGSTADGLTAAQQQQAIYNEVLVQSAKDLKTFGDAELTAAQKTQQFEAEIENLKVKIGKELIPIVQQGQKAWYSFIEALVESRGFQTTADTLDNIAGSMELLGTEARHAGEEISDAQAEQAKSMAKNAGAFGLISVALGYANKEWKEFLDTTKFDKMNKYVEDLAKDLEDLDNLAPDRPLADSFFGDLDDVDLNKIREVISEAKGAKGTIEEIAKTAGDMEKKIIAARDAMMKADPKNAEKIKEHYQGTLDALRKIREEVPRVGIKEAALEWGLAVHDTNIYLADLDEALSKMTPIDFEVNYREFIKLQEHAEETARVYEAAMAKLAETDPATAKEYNNAYGIAYAKDLEARTAALAKMRKEYPKQAQAIDALIAKEKKLVDLTTKYSKESLVKITEDYNKRLDASKGVLVKLEEQEKELAESIADINKGLVDKLEDINNERLGEQRDLDEKMRDLAYEGMSDQEAFYAKQKEASKSLAKAKEAIMAGELDAAKDYMNDYINLKTEYAGKEIADEEAKNKKLKSANEYLALATAASVKNQFGKSTMYMDKYREANLASISGIVSDVEKGEAKIAVSRKTTTAAAKEGYRIMKQLTDAYYAAKGNKALEVANKEKQLLIDEKKRTLEKIELIKTEMDLRKQLIEMASGNRVEIDYTDLDKIEQKIKAGVEQLSKLEEPKKVKVTTDGDVDDALNKLLGIENKLKDIDNADPTVKLNYDDTNTDKIEEEKKKLAEPTESPIKPVLDEGARVEIDGKVEHWKTGVDLPVTFTVHDDAIVEEKEKLRLPIDMPVVPKLDENSKEAIDALLEQWKAGISLPVNFSVSDIPLTPLSTAPIYIDAIPRFLPIDEAEIPEIEVKGKIVLDLEALKEELEGLPLVEVNLSVDKALKEFGELTTKMQEPVKVPVDFEPNEVEANEARNRQEKTVKTEVDYRPDTRAVDEARIAISQPILVPVYYYAANSPPAGASPDPAAAAGASAGGYAVNSVPTYSINEAGIMSPTVPRITSSTTQVVTSSNSASTSSGSDFDISKNIKNTNRILTDIARTEQDKVNINLTVFDKTYPVTASKSVASELVNNINTQGGM